MAGRYGNAKKPQIENDTALSFEDLDLVYFRDRHGAVCTVETATLQQSPCKLYQICKNFIAKNLHLVESLVNFPDVIGHDIFLEALQTKSLHQTPDFLNIFCVAYKALVLEHLALRQSSAVINENLNFLKCFNSLAELDLSHCRLGDNHEYLQWIGKMKSLECICLKDNCLTDIGILSWTLPHRMFQSGPELLRTLDLSCNPKITDSCVKCFVKFPHLKSLNLSGTSITIASGIPKIMNSTNLKLVSYIPVFSKEAFTETKGWASSFITELSSRSSCAKPDRNKTNSLNRKCFYQTDRCPALKVNTIKVDKCKVNSDNYPTLLLQSEELVLPDTLRNVDRIAVRKGKKRVSIDASSDLKLQLSGKKQKLTTQRCDKNIKQDLMLSGVENFDVEDSNLLENYLKYL